MDDLIQWQISEVDNFVTKDQILLYWGCLLKWWIKLILKKKKEKTKERGSYTKYSWKQQMESKQITDK